MNVDRLLTFVIRAMHGLLAATALFVICQPGMVSYS